MPIENDTTTAGSATGVSTAELIARLAIDARPVSRVWPPFARLALWLAVELCVVLAAILALGMRTDMGVKLEQAAFTAEIVLMLTVGLVSALLALLSAVPGREPARVIAAGACAGMIAGLGALYASEPALASGGVLHSIAVGWRCAANTTAVAAAPWLMLWIMVRRGATLVPGVSGLLAGSAAFFLAACAIRVNCPSDERWHLLAFHLAPVALGAAASAVVGRAWLTRWRRKQVSTM